MRLDKLHYYRPYVFIVGLLILLSPSIYALGSETREELDFDLVILFGYPLKAGQQR